MPQPVIETARLVLRQPEMDDADELVQVCSDWDVAKWTTRIPHPYFREDAVERISALQAAEGPDEEYMLAAFSKSDSHLVGLCGLTPLDKTGEAEIGFLIGKRDWGQGYGSELVAAIIRDGFERLNLDVIVAAVLPENPASIRLQEKLGFQYRGNSVKDAPARGCRFDLEVRVLTKEDWSKNHGR